MEMEQQVTYGANPYGSTLADNIASATGFEATYANGNIFIYRVGDVQADTKQWLYRTLESLPEIDYPIQRLQIIIYQDGALKKVVVINPAIEDVNALENAIEQKLKFSQPAGKLEALPLDHPYYSDKNKCIT